VQKENGAGAGAREQSANDALAIGVPAVQSAHRPTGEAQTAAA
jgi:hypothetical protein